MYWKYLCYFIALALALALVIVLFRRNTKLGDTHRLGNLIDAWVCGSLGSKVRKQHFRDIKEKSSVNSFGNYLQLDKAVRQHSGFRGNQELLDKIIEEASVTWPVLFYRNIVLTVPAYHDHLRGQMEEYATKKRPELLQLLSGKQYDLIVHYRMGDFVRLGQLVPIGAVVNACKSLDEANQIKKIGIMDGGTMHEETEEDDRIKTENLRKNLASEITQAFKNAEVTEVFGVDTDYDFFLCAGAPNLVTAGGSFAVCAAIACGFGSNVRTPACKNLNYPQQGQELGVREVRKGWLTYLYE